MAVKPKISKAKRNNQTKNKLVKQGVIKKSNSSKKAKSNVPNGLNIHKTNNPAENSEESDYGEDLLDMVDQDDMDFLKSAIANRSYSIYDNVKLSSFSGGPKPKRKKLVEDNIENEYEEQQLEDQEHNQTKLKNRLPIKTKTGIIPQQAIEKLEDNEVQIEEETEIQEEEQSDEEDVSIEVTDLDVSKPVLAKNEILKNMKLNIGRLSSSFLANPEEKITNLRTLLSMFNDQNADKYLSVKKILIISLLEVFKDILPSYEIKNFQSDEIKLKKATLKLIKYEESLLQYYKKFLQILQKCAYRLVNKKGETRKISEDEIQLGTLAVQAMCDLLATHPYFNFSQNVAQAIVPFLNNPNKDVRQLVKNHVNMIFKEDKKEEITLKILRIINNYLKNHPNVHTEVVEVTLVLNLKNVNLDQEREQDIREKKLLAHKQRILQLSKKERKRQKKLKEVEKELLETKAEENKQVKQRNLTEIAKIIFNIYFRILKNSNNTKILGVCLEGLAKYAHCLNYEFYIDIINVLDRILNEEWLSYREKLHCIQTVFIILSGQGDVLNFDPLRFYNSLYADLLSLNASSEKDDTALNLIKILKEALIKRRKKITNKRITGFVKRLSQLSLQLSHGGALGCLGVIKNIMHLHRQSDILLDLDVNVGDGKYNAEINDPEYSNAASSALYELPYLAHHYHPIVTKFARNIASGVPVTGEGSMPGEYAKSAPDQLYKEFDMSQMAFNPPVPPPTKVKPKYKPSVYFVDRSFQDECEDILKRPVKRKHFWIDL